MCWPAASYAPGYDSLTPGAVAEWLGRGLQSLVHRFESGPRLLDNSLLTLQLKCVGRWCGHSASLNGFVRSYVPTDDRLGALWLIEVPLLAYIEANQRAMGEFGQAASENGTDVVTS